jgi:hypothetical protein
MRTGVSRSLPVRPFDERPIRLGPPSDREDGLPRNVPSQPAPAGGEDLPYKVEIWNKAGASVEQVVAITANASIGYATYYAATREYPDRTLRCVIRTVSSFAGADHNTDIGVPA